MKPIKDEVNRVPNLREVVIPKEDGMPRGRWKLAGIENLIKSDIDEICGAARLQMPSGKIVRRPFRMIYPLEGSMWEDNVNRGNYGKHYELVYYGESIMLLWN